MPLPTSLLRDFRNGSGALFLGAGISAGTPGQRGFPLGRELSQQLAREYLGRNPRRDENLTEVAQAVIWAHAGSRQPLESFISNKYGDPSITPLPSHLALAQMAVPMITTNYDTLIEQAFRAKVRSVSVVLDDKDLIDAQHTPLIKIHGCVTQPETCIITEEDYHAWMSLDSDVKSLVRSWFIMRRVVFVGYSVADPNFRHLLLELQRKFGHSLRNCYVVTRHVDRNSYNYQFLVNAIRAQFIIVSAQEFLAELSSELIQNYVHYLQTDLVKDYLSIYTNISRPLSEFLGDRLLERIFTNSAGRIELDRQVTDSIHAAAVAQSGRLYVPSPGVTVEPGMVYVPAGEFIMGGDRLGNERIRVERIGQGYLIDECHVTNSQYRQFVDDSSATNSHQFCHPDEPSGKDHRPLDDFSGSAATDVRAAGLPADYFTNSAFDEFPVVNVDWWDSFAYAAWAKKRLPTEKEWEKAARGIDGRWYPYGNTFDPRKSNVAESGIHRPTAVRAYPDGRSPYGCYDMSGNVWDWCADAFVDDTPSPNVTRVLKGGSCTRGIVKASPAFRNGRHPGDRWISRGFRCVRDI